MRYILEITIILIVTFSALAQPSIDLVYPPEGHKMPAVSASFIYGSVTPGSVLSANGRKVEVEPNGAFMAYIPFEEGDFVIKLEAANQKGKSILERRVSVARARTSTPEGPPKIMSESIVPSRQISLCSGERLFVSFKGTPGLKASFRIGQMSGIAMVEQPALVERDEKLDAFGDGQPTLRSLLPGTYVGSTTFPRDGSWNGERIYCYLIDSLGNEYVDSTAPIITSWPQERQTVAVISDSFAVLKTWPDLGYEIFPPQGLKVQVTGQLGEYYRLRLSQNKESWIKGSSLKFLNPGQTLLPAKLALARVLPTKEGAEVFLILSRPVVFKIEPSDDCRSLGLCLFGARADMDWIKQPPFGLVSNINWYQPEPEAVHLNISLSQPFWGYDARYQDNILIVSIKRKPKIKPQRPFEGLRIAIDPGHSPDFGAVGPMRTLEKDINWQTAQVLGNKLKALGADVYYTREGDEGVGIYQRPRRAADWQADILVSIHHNASPDGANPLKNSGFSTYFYHPHSRRLAALVHREFQKRLGLPDHGFFYGNLVLCRGTQMPSFLVEPAFIIVPKQENLIRTETFQNKVAESIIAGMKKFLLGKEPDMEMELEELSQPPQEP